MASTILREYKELHDAIYHCKLCKKCGYPVERVQPKWDPSKAHSSTIQRWGMLIGQAPGKSEQRKRKPFIGPTGQRMRKWLLQASFSEDQFNRQFHKTSVTKCYPGKSGRNDRKPSKKEVELCSPSLREQIRIVDPVVLVPTGLLAINWFFPKVKRLEEVVGKRLSWSQGCSEYAVICLPHASPGSRWLNLEANRELLGNSIRSLSVLKEGTSRLETC